MRSTKATLRDGPAAGRVVDVDAWPHHYDAGKPVTRIQVALLPDGTDGEPVAYVLSGATPPDVFNRAHGHWIYYRLFSTDPVVYVVDGETQT